MSYNRQLSKLRQVRVLCVGDVMLDHFVYGEVTRISPEAPVPVLHVTRRESMLGGAGNAVRNLASVGTEVEFIAVIGDDEPGSQIEALCGDIHGIRLEAIRQQGRITSTKTRFIAHGQQLLRADSESTEPIHGTTFSDLKRQFERVLPVVQAVLVCDYAKGVLDADRVTQLIGSANDAGSPVIVDPKGTDFRRYLGATLLKPNLKELAIATGMPVHTEEQQITAAHLVMQLTRARYVLTTRGADGMLMVASTGEIRTFASCAREVYDVTGAGDTVAAVLAASLAAGLATDEAVEIANAAAGVVVGKLGTAVATPREILTQLNRSRLASPQATE